MILNGDFSLKIVVNNVENTANPEWVTWVNQFVGSSIESSEFDLSVRKPKHESGDVKLVESAHNCQGCNSTESESSMGLATNDVGNAAFRSLGGENILGYAFENVLVKVKELGDDGNNVRASEIALAELVHHEFTSFFDFFEKGINSIFV